MLKCVPACRCHETTVFKIHTSIHIQSGPMAVLTARGQPLCQSPVRKLLQGAVNPSEAQCLFHDINVMQYARRRSLAPAHDNPALFFFRVILMQPSPEL